MYFSVNSPALFAVVGLIIAFVVARSVFFLVRAYRRGLVIGMEKRKLNSVIKSAAVFTIAPAVGIFIGVITLSKKPGIALPWLRLSVIGSLTHELTAAENAAASVGASPTSEEGEIISTIATSSIVTTLIIALGVLLIVPLTPVLNSDVLTPAFDNVLPALFGAIGMVYISKNRKIAIAPIALMLVLFFFVPFLTQGLVGIMVPVGVLFSLAVSRVLYNKGCLGKKGTQHPKARRNKPCCM